MNKKKVKKDFIVISSLVIFCFGIILLAFGVRMYWVGYHSLDTGQNMRYLNAEYNLSVVDISSTGEIFDDTAAYRLGIIQMNLGFISTILGAFLLGMIYTDYSNLLQRSGG